MKYSLEVIFMLLLVFGVTTPMIVIPFYINKWECKVYPHLFKEHIK